jgi:carotenoid cleavage dioxygenase-like enzyme
MVVVKDHQQREPSMGDITTIGLDLAKNVFQVHAVDVAGSVVLRKRDCRLARASAETELYRWQSAPRWN